MFRNLFYMLLSACIMQASAQTGNVGVGTSNPAARLDIAGDVALREGTPIAVSGNNPTVTVSLNATQAENSFYRITGSPTGTMTLNSIANGVDGQLIRVVNTTTINLSVTTNNATNGILTPSMSAMGIPTYGNITLQYSAQMQRWYVANSVGSVSADWTKAITTSTPAVKTDHQYITGNAGIGDFSTVDPVAKLEIIGGADGDGQNDPRALAFQYRTGGFRHWIRTRHNGAANSSGNAIDFYLNNSTTAAGSSAPMTGTIHGMSITGAGVGIGTVVPYAKLDVLGSIYTTIHGSGSQHDAGEQGTTYVGMKSGSTADGFAGMRMQVGAFGSGGVNNGSRIFFQTWGNSISTSRDVMVINEYGNVGIGTSVPNTNLEIYKQDGKIRISDTRPDGGTAFGELGLEFTHHNTPITKTAIIAKGIYSWKRADLHFILDDGADDNSYVTGTDTKMIIKNNGNVGIGTIAPNAPLQFANTAVNRKIVMWDASNNDNQYYGFGINGGTLRYQVDGTSSAHKFYCGTSATTSKQLAAFGGDGNILLGDPNATAAHDVWVLPARPIGATGTYLRLGSATNAIQDVYSNFYYCGGSMHIGSTSSPTNPLEVRGAMSSNVGNNQNNYIVYVRNTLSGGGAIMTDVQTNGNSSRYLQCRVNGAETGCLYGNGSNVLSVYSASDQRLKTNITNTSLGLSTLMDMKVRQYNWKADGKTVRAGFIAQELYQVYPEAVSKGSEGELTNAEGEIWMVDYAGLTPLLVKAIQDQEAEIQKMKEENSLLKDRVEQIIAAKADAAEVQQLKMQMEEMKALLLNNASSSSSALKKQ